MAAFITGAGLHYSGVFDDTRSAAAPAARVNIGAHRADFVLTDMDGNRRHIDEWRDKVIILNFWATWCAPCLEEIPMFIELQQRYRASGVQFIGIALQDAEEVRGYSEAVNIPYPLLFGGDEVIKIGRQYGNEIGAIPYTVMVDREGKIAFQKRGALSKSEAEQSILALL